MSLSRMQYLNSRKLSRLCPSHFKHMLTPRFCRFDVEWKTYEDGGHWIHEPQGVDDIVAFLTEKVIKA